MLFTEEFKTALKESIDGPHGYVIAKDRKTGKILINKHNMIVQTGKEYMWSIFLNHQKAVSDAFDQDLLGLYLKRAVFSDKTDEVAYTNVAPTDSNLKFALSFENEMDANISAATFSEYNGHRFMSFTFSISGSMLARENNPLKSISSLELQLVPPGLQLNDTSSSIKLFSRIRFDTIPLTLDSDIEIVYYIYF